VVVFDDLHWAEETLLDLIEHVADLSRDAPIVLLCTARPELLERRPAWGGGKWNATAVFLEPLDTAETERLLAELGGAPDDLRERIIQVAEGNPLFLEETLTLVRHSGGDVVVPPTIRSPGSRANTRRPPATTVARSSPTNPAGTPPLCRGWRRCSPANSAHSDGMRRPRLSRSSAAALPPRRTWWPRCCGDRPRRSSTPGGPSSRRGTTRPRSGRDRRVHGQPRPPGRHALRPRPRARGRGTDR
jgi:hypothetical protein